MFEDPARKGCMDTHSGSRLLWSQRWERVTVNHGKQFFIVFMKSERTELVALCRYCGPPSSDNWVMLNCIMRTTSSLNSS